MAQPKLCDSVNGVTGRKPNVQEAGYHLRRIDGADVSAFGEGLGDKFRSGLPEQLGQDRRGIQDVAIRVWLLVCARR